jgi:acyl-CoA reductase-like NAD-dependent aldehyde dehydrogenase
LGSHDQEWQDCLFADGAFRPPARGGSIGVRDKASGEIFARAGMATEADVDSATATALAAQQAWRERTYAERAGLLRDVAAALADRAKSFRESAARSRGRPAAC